MPPPDRQRLRKALGRGLRAVLLAAALLYCGLIAALYIKQRDLIYFPDRSLPAKPAPQAGRIVQDLIVTTQDGLRLRGWFIAPGRPDQPVILFFHGNAGHIAHRLTKTQHYVKEGYGLLLAGYRGYGGNPATPSEAGLYADGRAYLSWLSAAGYADERLILYGESLGTGVAVQLAGERAGARNALCAAGRPGEKAIWLYPLY